MKIGDADTEREDGPADRKVGRSLSSMPTLSKAATQLAAIAAQHQFQTLSLYGVGENVSAAAAARPLRDPKKALKQAFIDGGFMEFDSNGLNDLIKFSAAYRAIRDKAAALGYGAASNSVEITAVPGGYVGRFGGNDIYASAR